MTVYIAPTTPTIIHTAMGKLTNDESEIVYKQGCKPSEYLDYK